MYMITSFLSGLAKRLAAMAAGDECSIGSNIVAPPASKTNVVKYFWTQHGEPPVNRHSGLKTPLLQAVLLSDVAGQKLFDVQELVAAEHAMDEARPGLFFRLAKRG